MKKITELVAELAAPAVEAQGCILWDVEYVREGGAWYLRLYIDKLEGSVDILDCEAVSRSVEPLLDEADPIEGSYTFEVRFWTKRTPLRAATPSRSAPRARNGSSSAPRTFSGFWAAPYPSSCIRPETAGRNSPEP